MYSVRNLMLRREVCLHLPPLSPALPCHWLQFEKVLSMNKYKNRENRRSEFKDKIIERKNGEIEVLKELIEELQIECSDKDDVISSVDEFRKELKEIIEDLRDKSKEYDKLIKEVREMKNSLNEIVFKKRWKIIKWLLK